MVLKERKKNPKHILDIYLSCNNEENLHLNLGIAKGICQIKKEIEKEKKINLETTKDFRLVISLGGFGSRDL